MFLVLLMTLIAGFDEWGKSNVETQKKVLCTCRQVNLRINKDKCLFWCMITPIFGKIGSLEGMSPDSCKIQACTNRLKTKKELWSFSSILNYLSSHQQLQRSVSCYTS